MSPSERDGLTPEQVAAFKRTAINTIIEAGARLHMDVVAIAAGCEFLHRFYAVKSLVRNDPFIFGAACLYLGGKVKDSPKSVRDVLMASCELRFRDAARRLTHERDLYDRLREQVFVAERALLYALNFSFDVDPPHTYYVRMLTSEPLRSHRERLAARDARRNTQIWQLAYNFTNDSVKTEACLHYRGPQIAAACIWLALKLLKEDTHILNDQGQLWWVALGVREEDLEGVEEHMQALYTQDTYALSANKDFLPQSLGLLSPQQLAAAAAKEQQAAAAAAAAPQQQQQQAVGALPADVAAANRDSWAAVAAPAAAAADKAVGAAQLGAQQAAAAAAPKQQEEDYDDLLAELSPQG